MVLAGSVGSLGGSFLGMAAGSVLIPVPVVGGIIGSLIGGLIGRLIGVITASLGYYLKVSSLGILYTFRCYATAKLVSMHSFHQNFRTWCSHRKEVEKIPAVCWVHEDILTS